MKIFNYKWIIVFLFFFMRSNFLLAREINQNYLNYIDTYSTLAIEVMHKYKIPASVTLAQALLESEAGESILVKETNNHFGIKCHRDWIGECYYYSDDKQNECFRKYKKAKDSFEDYSSFLHKNRYSSLFMLDINDYTGWAIELQKCGYASDKFYANKLIKLIEDYKLYQFDKNNNLQIEYNTIVHPFGYVIQRKIYISYNGLLYILAKEGDNYETIAKDIKINAKNLISYNEIPQNSRLNKDDILYLEKKKKKAKIPYFKYVVKKGETMHKISQLYGICIKNLYKLNKKSFDYIPMEGDTLQLR